MTSPDASTREESSRVSRASAALAAATLTTLALPQPALAVIAAAPTFLVAHRAGPRDVALLLAIGCFALPAAAALLAWALCAVGERTERHGLSLGLGVLATLALLAVFGRLPVSGAWLGAPILGGLLGWAFPRRPGARWLVAALSPALVAVPLAFALHPQVRRATALGEGVTLAPVEATAPVVVLVLDEWSFGSLLDPTWVLSRADSPPPRVEEDWRGALDAQRLPRLARFAEGATWYANARAASDATEIAVPALLGGRFPRPGSLPSLADHPDNLFTRLGGSYRVAALEPVTALCPPGLDRLATALGASTGARPTALLADVAVVWLHAVAPRELEQSLPPIAQKWSGFLEPEFPDTVSEARADSLSTSGTASFDGWPEQVVRDRVEPFRGFLRAIEPGDRQLYFAHLLLPHVPLEYLPSGQRYLAPQSRLPGLDGQSWGDDQRLADQALQRYLLQVSFVDRLLGELFDRLEQTGLFDDALIVLTADHGASFRAGAARRMFEPANAADVVPVPLFVKLPGQREAAVQLEPVTALDVLPTVLAAIGLEPGQELDGRSLLTPREPRSLAQSPRRFYAKHRGELHFSRAEDPSEQRLAAARHQAELLASAGRDLFRVGLSPELLEGSVPAGRFAVATAGGPGVVFDGGRRDRPVASAPFTGQLIEGALRDSGPSDSCCTIAVARGGELVAGAPLYTDTRGRTRFSALLPPARTGEAAGGVAFFRVDRHGALHPLPVAGESARLERAADGKLTAVVLDGERMPVDPRVEGFFERVTIHEEHVAASGWAVDRGLGAPAERVLLFLGDEMVAAGPFDSERPDVAGAEGDDLESSGFELRFSSSEPARVRREGLTAVAISRRRSARLAHFYRELARDTDGGVTILATNGREIAVGSGAVKAWLDRVQRTPGPSIDVAGAAGTTASGAAHASPRGERLALIGWAADIGRGGYAERVVAFERGSYLAQAWPGLAREDLVAPLGPEFRDAGFVLHLPRAPRSLRDGTVQLVAIGHDGAAAFVALRSDLLEGLDLDGVGRDPGTGGSALGPP